MKSHRPRKRYGQHFLHDPAIIARIVAGLAPQPDDILVEIGPGLGALTLPLLAAHEEVFAVEIDRSVIPELERRAAGQGKLHLIEADALRVDFHRFRSAGKRLRLVGNLPYNISTPLLFHVLEQAEFIHDMHFMLQKEVVERMVATPGGRDYGRLTVMLAYRCRVEALFRIGRGAFTPPPQVESAMVRMVPHRRPPFAAGNPGLFKKLVRHAFAQRRKTVKNALKGCADEAVLRQAGIDPLGRPEQVSPAEFGALAEVLSRTAENRPPNHG
jgi:16S rRNA (adenine1518-N6/adenine1519-N6)-dimethyltransferase